MGDTEVSGSGEEMEVIVSDDDEEEGRGAKPPPDCKWHHPREIYYQGVNGDPMHSHSFCLFSLRPKLSMALDAPPFEDCHSQAKSRTAFASTLVDEALAEALVMDGDAALHRLLRMLQGAFRTRDASATSVIWMKVEELLTARDVYDDDNDARPPLGLQDVRFTHALLTWLLFHVRQPHLLLCMIHDRNRHLKETGHRLEVWDWRPHRDAQNPRDEAEGMVAAVMDAVYCVKPYVCNGVGNFDREAKRHHHNLNSLPNNTNMSWFKLLSKLYAILPTHPQGLRLRTMNSSSAWVHYETGRPAFGLLELAVRCSEITCAPLQGVLGQCFFSPQVICDAFASALKPGVLRGGTVLEVMDLLLKAFASKHAIPTPESREALQKMWLGVADHATQVKDYALTSTRAGVISIPKPKLKGEHHPDVFVHIVEALGALDQPDHVRARLEHVLKFMTHVDRMCPHLTYLLEAILRLWHRHIAKPWYLEIPNIVPRLLEFHPRAFDIVEPHITTERSDGTRVVKGEHAPLLVEALRKLIAGKHRDSTRRVMELFDKLPPAAATYEFLHAYVFNLVKRLHANTWLGKDMLRLYNQHMKDDFALFLKLGQFSEELLKKVLTVASRRESTIAVEVLTSPPYNVRHDADDTFAAHVVEAMFKPGEQTVAEVGEGWSKRQKV